MSKILDEDLLFQIFSVVEEIPEGRVATYGQISKLIGMDKNARLVGKALGLSNIFGEYPCHRVVNHMGRLVPNWKEQKSLLLREGIVFKDNSCVDLNKCKWNN